MLLSLKQLDYISITLELLANVSEGSRRSPSLRPTLFFSLFLDHQTTMLPYLAGINDGLVLA